jgi:hypothetical protein
MATNAVKKQQVHAAESTSRTVVVACKIPNGLILQLQHPVKRMEDTRDGPEPRTYNAFGGKRIYIWGPAYPVGTIPKGFPKPPMIEGGYALTRGVPMAFWEQWLEQNKLAPFVQAPDGAEHGMIFAYEDLDSVVSAAREQEGLLSGMEPLSQDEDKNGRLTDPRLPRPMNAGITKVSHDVERETERGRGING